mgnify:CR=1 FL=1
MPRPSKKKPEQPTFIGHYAGFVTRLAAFTIDILVVTFSISFMWGILALILRFFSFDLELVLTAIAGTNSFFRFVVIFLTGFGFTFFVALVYNIFFWMLAGKTLGKAVMGIRIIGPRGTRMTFMRSLRRYLGYWISALPLFMGYVWVLITDERVGWHDIFAGTRVIYDHEAKYSETFLSRLTHLAPKLEAKRNESLKDT